MLAALVHIPPNIGYAAVFAFIAVETMGIPVPGETVLIGAALLAHDGQLDIVLLVAIAAAAAIVGDNVGFTIGRHGGRRLLLARGPGLRHRRRVIEYGEPFFERHGPKAVFLGRWMTGLRIASAWLAGINGMKWPTFLFWNALGGIAWAASVGFAVYALGHFAEQALSVVGAIAAGLTVAAIVGIVVWRRRRERARAR
jgi:membrane protein DedA with SNARE-associated domain